MNGLFADPALRMNLQIVLLRLHDLGQDEDAEISRLQCCKPMVASIRQLMMILRHIHTRTWALQNPAALGHVPC